MMISLAASLSLSLSSNMHGKHTIPWQYNDGQPRKEHMSSTHLHPCQGLWGGGVRRVLVKGRLWVLGGDRYVMP